MLRLTSPVCHDWVVSSTPPRAPRNVPTAKRDRVRQHILEFIQDAGPGSSLASERDLADTLGVSRPTVRAAIEELTRSGLLVRHQGRGTFTSPHVITQELTGSTGTALVVPPAEGAWTSRVVTFKTLPAGATRAARFGIGPEDAVRRVVRVRIVEDEPIAIETLELPALLVPRLSAADMESGNFYHLLRERYGIIVAEAVQTMEPAVTNPEQADLLDVPVYAPILRIERTTKDTEGRTVEHTQSVYRGDRYRITSKLRFDHTSG
jgi:GntR family transcriptional regulator